MAEYRSLLEELAQNITAEDLEQLKSACKEDIPSEESEAIATSHHWFAFLEKHSKLDRGETPPSRVALAPVPVHPPLPSPGRCPDPDLSPGLVPNQVPCLLSWSPSWSPDPCPGPWPLPRSMSPLLIPGPVTCPL